MAAAVLLVGTAATASRALGARGVDRGPVADASSATSAGVGDFYVPPEPLPDGPPGDLIRSRPFAGPEGARAWRVLYHSRNLAGDDVAVSGVVVAPDGPAPKRGRPVVAFAHGTTGIGDGCAPSHADDATARLLWIDDLVAAGYVVAATDYEGLGTPGVHPYLVGESEGRAVLDSVRAARALPAGAGRKVVVLGHSQGGHAALFAGELARAYAPELAVRGVAPGAPVADVESFLDHTTDTGLLAFLVMGAKGFTAAYPELAAEPLLTPDAESRSDVAVYGCVHDVASEFAADEPAEVFARDPRAIPAWQRRLRENAAGRRRSDPPVFVWQGDDDPLTPADHTDRYVARACARGTEVEYRRYPGADHATVVGAARADVLDFLASRFAGQPPVDDCG